MDPSVEEGGGCRGLVLGHHVACATNGKEIKVVLVSSHVPGIYGEPRQQKVYIRSRPPFSIDTAWWLPP